MRPIQSVLLPLVFLTASVASVAAQNVCVHGADGAIVCGPVASTGGNGPGPGAGPGGGGPNPWDKPAQNFRPPSDRPGQFVDRRTPLRRAVREAERHAPPPRHAYREPPPRDLERRPPPRHIAREDARRYSERDYRSFPPPQADRVRSARYPDRYPDMERRRYDEQRGQGMPIDPRYEARLRELEREIRELRGERDRYALPPPPRAPKRFDRYTAND